MHPGVSYGENCLFWYRHIPRPYADFLTIIFSTFPVALPRRWRKDTAPIIMTWSPIKIVIRYCYSLTDSDTTVPWVVKKNLLRRNAVTFSLFIRWCCAWNMLWRGEDSFSDLISEAFRELMRAWASIARKNHVLRAVFFACVRIVWAMQSFGAMGNKEQLMSTGIRCYYLNVLNLNVFQHWISSINSNRMTTVWKRDGQYYLF